MTVVLDTAHLTKSFGHVAAIKDVSFSLQHGEIRALCGENGAGKSTFVKMLMGIVAPDAGSISLNGTNVSIHSPQHAQSLGLGLVAQELSLVPHLSIVDNIWLGSDRVPLFYRIKNLRKLAQRSLEILGVGDWELDVPVSRLQIGNRQIVEIARLLARDARILILDEPTATLSDREITRLLSVLKSIKAKGHAVIYITHRLGEVFDLCDTVTIFRNGEHVTTDSVSDFTRASLVDLMLGRPSGDMYPSGKTEITDAAEVLSVRDLHVPNQVYGLSFAAKRGEILGIAGQIGSGANVVTRALAGIIPDAGGDVKVNGERLQLGSVPASLARTIHFLSEDRAAEGLFPVLPVLENLVASSLPNLTVFGMLDWRRLRREADNRARRVGVDTARLQTPVGKLSGGNQQKVLFGRSLRSIGAGILLLNEPTRGVDVGARAEIYRLMRQLGELGYTIVLTTSDLEELVAMSDRVLTMYRGREVARHERPIAITTILAEITNPAKTTHA